MNFLFLFFLSVAQAGFLRMSGDPHLELQKKGSKLYLVGTYQIKNLGDEKAFAVFPRLQIGDFNWMGSPEELDARQEASWSLDEDITPQAGPLKGEFLVKVRKSYQDINSFHFDIPDLFILKTADAAELAPDIRLRMEIQPPGRHAKEFVVSYSAQSASEDPVKLDIDLLLPKEVQLLTPLVPIDLPAGGEVEGSLDFRNERGLAQSYYVAYVTAEWEEHGFHRSAFTYRKFQIADEKSKENWSRDQAFWAWWLWGLSVGLIGMWFFWTRPLRKLRR